MCRCTTSHGRPLARSDCPSPRWSRYPATAHLPQSDGVTWFDLTDRYDELLPALLAHASQFRVDGRDAIHSGGQREPLQLRTGVRPRA